MAISFFLKIAIFLHLSFVIFKHLHSSLLFFVISFCFLFNELFFKILILYLILHIFLATHTFGIYLTQLFLFYFKNFV